MRELLELLVTRYLGGISFLFPSTAIPDNPIPSKPVLAGPLYRHLGLAILGLDVWEQRVEYMSCYSRDRQRQAPIRP